MNTQYSPSAKRFFCFALSCLLAASAFGQLAVSDVDINTIDETYDFLLLSGGTQTTGVAFSSTDLGGALIPGSVLNFPGGPEAGGGDGSGAYFWFAWDTGARAEFKMGWDLSSSSYGIDSVDFSTPFDQISSGSNQPTVEYSTDGSNFTSLSVVGTGLQSYSAPSLGGADQFIVRLGYDMDTYSFPNNQWGRGLVGDTAFSATFNLTQVPESSTTAMVIAIGALLGVALYKRLRK